jgi:hypothetical protein
VLRSVQRGKRPQTEPRALIPLMVIVLITRAMTPGSFMISDLFRPIQDTYRHCLISHGEIPYVSEKSARTYEALWVYSMLSKLDRIKQEYHYNRQV